MTPLFRASDIAEILELSNVEKVVRKSSTLGGLQEVAFLTEKGLLLCLEES